MNLGDGLLFELENGKPKLILLSRGVKKKSAKPSFRPRAATVLSSRQPSCAEEAQGEERPARQQQVQVGRNREPKSKAGGAATSFTANITTSSGGGGGRSSTLTSSKTHEHPRGPSVKPAVKVKSDDVGRKHGNAGDGKTGRRPTGPLAGGDAGPKESAACLTNQQLQKILHTVQSSSVGRRPAEDHRAQVNQTDSKEAGASNGDGGEMKEEDRGGGGGTDTNGRSQDKVNRTSGCPFSWLEERQSDSRAAIDAKKALWRRELDEQVALKQQRSAPGRLQAEDDSESVFSVRSSVGLREQQHAAVRSSLRLGEVTPMEEEPSERREAERRRWLQELQEQREEEGERRRRERMLERETEDHHLWALHFDSMLHRPPVRPAAPSAASTLSERGDWEPTSSLSLVWEAESVGGASVGGASMGGASVGGASVGGASVGGASMDATSGYPARASYLRTMTALLDPAQIEERERRRSKQLEHQRAIEAQVEERRLLRKREEETRREELEEEERKVAQEREALERRYELDAQRERQKASNRAEEAEQLRAERGDHEGRRQETQETEETSASSLPLRGQTPDVSAQYEPPPLPPSPPPPPPNISNRAARTGKENICLPGGEGGRGRGGGGDEDPYAAFARTERSRRDVRRPEWNTQRPSRRFVPASQRYSAPLQRSRQESRLRRQEELLALQERTCASRAEPPPLLPPPLPPQHQEPHNPTQTRSSPTSREEASRGHDDSAAERGRCSPPDHTGRQRGQSQQASSSSSPPLHPPHPAPPLPLEFIPYVRTDEVFNMDPLEPADTPPPHTHTAPHSSASPRLLQSELLRNTKTHRQQEILRGLAQLRQGLLQKQRELETDLNPLLKRHDIEHRSPAATQRK